ncbi:GntR family transcriptional regulator [Arthrobacter russicus]|uniref:GntR family transcriptional regulator n=1 Tax=Arthrobacter russicus TaxID=172040 RepID=UPI003CF83EC7
MVDTASTDSSTERRRSGEVRPLQIRSVVDSLYSDLRNRLLLGELEGGLPLTELDLAAQYGVARPTAKAAMERLVQEGLLMREQNRSTRVPLVTVEWARDLYMSRLLMERSAVRALATSVTVPDSARDQLAEFEVLAAMADPNVMDVVSCDIAFHTALIDALELARFSALYKVLIGEVQLGMVQVQRRGLRTPPVQALEHAGILAAIAAGDVEGADAAISDHIEGACDQLTQAL